jgi:hypothetical protein
MKSANRTWTPIAMGCGLAPGVLGAAIGCAAPTENEVAPSGESHLTAGHLTGTLAVTSAWESGYCAALTLKNAGAAVKWVATVNVGSAKVTQSWSSKLSRSGDTLTLKGLSYNEVIPQNGSAEVGFCATGNGTPKLLTLNGQSGSEGTGGTSGSGGSSGSSSGGLNGSGTGGSGTGGSGTGGSGTGGSSCTELVPRGSDPLVQQGRCGKLVYRKYAAHDQSNAVHQLPDFSHAGYKGGGVAIPSVRVVETVSPKPGDAHKLLQDAIDRVAQKPLGADGFRGAVLIKRGRYEVSDSLVIPKDGIVLRGEGQGAQGTTLVDTSRKPAEAASRFIQLNGPTTVAKEIAGTRTRIASSMVAVGATSFEVESASAFKVGDTIMVQRTPNDKWLTTLGTKDYGWTTGWYTLEHERKVVSVNGKRLTIDVPIVDAMETQFGGGAVYKTSATRLANVGIEDVRLEAVYTGPEDEAHGWSAIFLGNVTNAWVRRVTARHFAYSTVNVNGATFSTVEDAAYVDPISKIAGGRRYAFAVNGGMGVLFQRLYARAARHAFVSGAAVTGPHVWLDGLSEGARSDDGPHHRWATGLLFDNVKVRALSAGNAGGNVGTGHGWKGAQTLFFNSEANTLVCDAPSGSMNYAIGCKATLKSGTVDEDPGIIESLGRRVSTRSLYIAQLRDRLGQRAVDAVTLPKQRRGTIWDELSAWKGEGALAPKLQ